MTGDRGRLNREEALALVRALTERGVDFDRIGAASGLGADTVRLIAEGRLIPVPEIRRKLAAALGIDPREVQ